MKYVIAGIAAFLIFIGAASVAGAIDTVAASPGPIVVDSALLKQIAWEALKAAWESIASSVQGPAAIMGIAGALAAFLPPATEGTVWWWMRKAINLVALNILNARNESDAKPIKAPEQAANQGATA